MRYLFLGTGMVLGAGLLMGAQRLAKYDGLIATSLSVEKFSLVDSKGNIRLKMFVDEESNDVGFGMFDSKGKSTITIFGADDGSEITFYRDAKSRIKLIEEDGNSVIRCYDKNGKVRSMMGMAENTSFFMLLDENEKVVHTMQ